MSRIFSCTVLLTLCTVCSGYKVLLVFPFPSNSYAILGEKYVNLLVSAGHEVTYITPYLMNNNFASSFRHIHVSSNVQLVPGKLWNITHILCDKKDLENNQRYLNVAFKISNSTVLHADVQNLLMDTDEEFDAVVVDWLYNEILSGFAAVFNCPLIWATSMEPNAFILSLLDKNLITSQINGRQSPYFGQWAAEKYKFLRMKYNKWLISDKEISLFNEAFGPAMMKRGGILPSFEEVKYYGSLMLGNSHPTIDWVPGLPMNYIPVAGYHIEDNPIINEDVKTIMDNANEGVILFSMGSDFTSNSLPERLRIEILDVFEEINRTVLWQYEGIFEVPSNIHTIPWLTQQGILAHPNCVLMITSGGLLSINEAIHFGVPIIGIPFLREHANNIEKAKNKGFAKKVKLNNNFLFNLKAAINEVLNNSTYIERVQELSAIYRDRPIPPSKELVFWIEHVIRTKGALHLRYSVPLLSWYQNLYLEVIVIVIIVIAIVGLLIQCVLEKRAEDNLEYKKFI